MKPLKEKISITIDGDTLQKIKEKAEMEDRSLSQYINLVLRRHLLTSCSTCDISEKSEKVVTNEKKQTQHHQGTFTKQ